jgi:hypothetical protein
MEKILSTWVNKTRKNKMAVGASPTTFLSKKLEKRWKRSVVCLIWNIKVRGLGCAHSSSSPSLMT